ncbi:MAG: class I SAM-dependent methyltransferase [Drouetiella hepatica Uher 2000/2452]|jgi:cyclopropane-fatty-acyl-phospholipid synthase|uniref:Class I SAM-dependent methyltransferase n=1 Tax=Drouetiella hepatica Uher 2000/2452 TaxID=904376 RepID=A0A951Q9K5_9CYAN|nr:class I SAM-dependent methyltransferase [Drouetiella hepatica Uher 2000/2452]
MNNAASNLPNTRDLPNNLPSGELYLYQLLSLIETGYLTVVNPQGKEFNFGTIGTVPELRLIIHNQNTYDRILTFGSLGFCEAYMEGWWDEASNNLVGLTQLFFRNGVYKKARDKATLPLMIRVVSQRLRTLPTQVQNSRKNVQHHYDLGNDFYQQFLDRTLTYSCGYQMRETDSLEEMQLQKYELICRKLALQPGESLIDIGCGWGGMLIYAAEHYGISGTGITLSKEQGKLAQERIEQKGLGDRLKIVLSDYREIQGEYDKFVSIGMFEHVGKDSFGTFMGKAKSLLKPNGIGLLHTIVTEGVERNGAWVDKYIFPGGCLPHLYEIAQAMRAERLTIAHCENLRPHYAETLRQWGINFTKNKDEIKALSPAYDDRFLRMWDLYLQTSEASFRDGALQVHQILFYKDKQWPLTIPLDFSVPHEKPSPI